jgi:hypothetical protein
MVPLGSSLVAMPLFRDDSPRALAHQRPAQTQMLTQSPWSDSAAFCRGENGAQIIMPSAAPADPGRHRADLGPRPSEDPHLPQQSGRRNQGNESLKDHPQRSSFRHDLNMDGPAQPPLTGHSGDDPGTRRRALSDPSSLVITLPSPPAARHPIHKGGLADLECASEQSARLSLSRQARHKDVVRKASKPLDQRSQLLAAVGS